MDPTYLWWFAWLVIFFLPKELWAAFKTPGRKDTFSEFTWWAFDTNVKRVILGIFLTYLQGHLIFKWPGLWVIVLGAPVGTIIGRRMYVETTKQYSFKIGLKQVAQHLAEIGVAVAGVMLPQLGQAAADIITNTPPEQFHVPSGYWTIAWIAGVRLLNNWRKNR